MRWGTTIDSFIMFSLLGFSVPENTTLMIGLDHTSQVPDPVISGATVVLMCNLRGDSHTDDERTEGLHGQDKCSMNAYY